MKKINPAEFRHYIKIQRCKETPNDDGVPVKKWDDLISTKAKVANVKFEEVLIAQGEGVTDIKTFYIRFKKDIKRTDRIVFDKDVYNIKSLNDIENRGFYLAIKGEYTE